MNQPDARAPAPSLLAVSTCWKAVGLSVAAGLGAALSLFVADWTRLAWGSMVVEAGMALALAKGCLALGGAVMVLTLLAILLRQLIVPFVGTRWGTWVLAIGLSLPFLPLVLGTLSGRWLQSSGWAGPSIGSAMVGIVLALRLSLNWSPMLIRPPRAWLKGMVLSLACLVISVADARILPKLYPDFHTALSLMFLVSGGLLGALGFGRRLVLVGRRTWITALVALMLLLPLGAAWLGHIPGKHDREREVLLWLAPMNARLMVHTPWLFTGQRQSEAYDGSGYVIRRPSRVEASRLDQAVPGRKDLNVLLITIDALRADQLSCYRDSAQATKVIDALAAQSVLFEQAYATHPSSQLSLASLFKGRYPTGTDIMARRNLSAQLRRPPRDLPLASIFQGLGRKTYGLSALPRSYTDGEFVYLKAGFDEFNPQAHSRTLDAADVTNYAVRCLEQQGDQPFFLWLHYFDPHAPYRPHGAGLGSLSRRERYAGEVQHADAQLAGVLEALKRLELDDKTVIVLHADHGEEFGEHGGSFHGSSLYEEQLRVPLIIRIPGLDGERIETPVALVDVVPTLAELIGFEVPHVVHGESLLSRFGAFRRKQGSSRDYVAFAQRVDRVPEQETIRSGQWKLIVHRRTGLSELYDLKNDPGEQRSVAAQHPEELARLRSMLLAHRRLADDDAQPTAPSTEPESRASRMQRWLLDLRKPDHGATLEEIVAFLNDQESDGLCGAVLSQVAPFLRADDISALQNRALRGAPQLRAQYVFALAFQGNEVIAKALPQLGSESEPRVLGTLRALKCFSGIDPEAVTNGHQLRGEAWLLWRLSQLRETAPKQLCWSFAGLLRQATLRFDLQLLCLRTALRSNHPAFAIATYSRLLDPKCLVGVPGYCLVQRPWVQVSEHAPILRKFLALFPNEPEAQTIRQDMTEMQFNVMETVDALILDARDYATRGALSSVLGRLQSANKIARQAGFSDWGVWLEALLTAAMAGVLPDFATLDQNWFPPEPLEPEFAKRLRERLGSWSQKPSPLRGSLRCSHWEGR